MAVAEFCRLTIATGALYLISTSFLMPTPSSVFEGTQAYPVSPQNAAKRALSSQPDPETGMPAAVRGSRRASAYTCF
jgi:hypothetical protein